jgi:uncharacterized protein YcbK (DUF882 family)
MQKLFRRQFIKFGVVATTAGIAPRFARAVTQSTERRLAFYSTHTGEKLDVVYRIGNDYIPESLAQVNRVLRDHRTDEVWAIDLHLLDLLHTLSSSLQVRGAFHVISGYRSPLTNTALASNSDGVAKHSLHVEGKAIDIRLPGLDLPQLRAAAVALRGGGVGYYSRSDFVHVDVGRVRYW